MSDEFFNVTDEAGFSAGSEEDFEEISSDDVDRVVEALEELAATTDSENIRYYLDEAANRIYELIYDDESETAEDEHPRDEAA